MTGKVITVYPEIPTVHERMRRFYLHHGYVFVLIR